MYLTLVRVLVKAGGCILLTHTQGVAATRGRVSMILGRCLRWKQDTGGGGTTIQAKFEHFLTRARLNVKKFGGRFEMDQRPGVLSLSLLVVTALKSYMRRTEDIQYTVQYGNNVTCMASTYETGEYPDTCCVCVCVYVLLEVRK